MLWEAVLYETGRPTLLEIIGSRKRTFWAKLRRGGCNVLVQNVFEYLAAEDAHTINAANKKMFRGQTILPVLQNVSSSNEIKSKLAAHILKF